MPYLETTSIVKSVSARIGANMRKARIERGMTQARLASPEFSVSYISAIEHGKLRPSIKALSVLAQRLGVPVTLLLESSPAADSQSQILGYAPVNSDESDQIEVELLQAAVLLRQGAYEEAMQLLLPLAPSRLAPPHAYQFFLLRGQIALAWRRFEEAIADLRAAIGQAEALKERELAERARNLLGKANFLLSNYTLAEETHRACATAIEEEEISDSFFALEVYCNLVDDCAALDEFERANTYMQRAQALVEQLDNDERSYAQLSLENSQRSRAAGRFLLARDQAARSCAIYQMRGLQLQQSRLHQELGRALEKQEKTEEAEQKYLQATEMARPLRDSVSFAQSLIALAELASKRGDVRMAEQQAQEAIAITRASGDTRARGQALLVLAQLRQQAGDYAEADRAFEEGLALLEETRDHDLVASAYFHYASQLEARGEIQRSLSAIKQAYRHRQQNRSSAVV
jgi:tetratricopeptide (TPR) repeat protein